MGARKSVAMAGSLLLPIRLNPARIMSTKTQWIILIAATPFLVLALIFALLSVPTDAPKEEEGHRILQEDDSFSRPDCRIITVRVLVEDDATEGEVDDILDQVIQEYKLDWDDVTAWAYPFSDEEQVGQLEYTEWPKGVKSYSDCY